MKVIRSTKHHLTAVNSGKRAIIGEFLACYRTALRGCIDYLWSTDCYRDEKLVFSVSKDLLDLPKFLSYKDVPNQTHLSARAFCSAFEQAIGIVRSRIETRRRYLWLRSKIAAEGGDTARVDKKLSKLTLSKPFIKDSCGAELSSKCISFSKDSKHFDLFVRLGSSGFDPINIPISFHRVNHKLRAAKLLGGICLTDSSVILRFESEVAEKTEGRTVGADTGALAVVTLSDGQTPPAADRDGHSLDSIMRKLSRQRRDSRAFHRTQAQRENFINWSLNQLNLSDVREIRLEQINTFKGGKRSRYLSHFAHALISQKIERMSELLGVQVVPQRSPLKSQRCSACGAVHKTSRKGRRYRCQSCLVEIDADLNSALNNEIDLPAIPAWVVASKLNRQGFLWKPEGLFGLDGRELRVPDAEENEHADQTACKS